MSRLFAAALLLALAQPALADQFRPDPIHPAAPTEIDGKTIDYRGLITGATPEEVAAWWAEQYPGIQLSENKMTFEGNLDGAFVSMGPFTNKLEASEWLEDVYSAAEFHFNGFGGGNQLFSFEVRTRYQGDQMPLREDVVAALKAKYGEPTAYTDYQGFEKLAWAFKDGQPVTCNSCSVPILGGYSTDWFRDSTYRSDEYDFSLEATVHQYNMGSPRVDAIEVNAIDARKLELGMDADMEVLMAESRRILEAEEARRAAAPAPKVTF